MKKLAALILVTIVGVICAASSPAAAGYCFGLAPLCAPGAHAVCICPSFGYGCYWTCSY